jgi:hypothetical protein
MTMPRMKADHHAQKADCQRDARTVYDAREHVAAQPVGAEQEQLPVLGRAEQVGIHLHQPPPPVCVAFAEKPYLVGLGAVLAILALQRFHVEFVLVAIHERADERSLVEQAYLLRRSIDVVYMACLHVVGRQKLADEDRRVQDGQEYTAPHRNAMLLELPPHQLPLRREVDLFLVGRNLLDRHHVERLVRNIVPHGLSGPGQG